MKSITIVSQKGGVGKTTLALNLSFALARTGIRTVLIDADPQGAIGHSLRGSKTSGGLVSVLEGSADPRSVLLQTRLPEFNILPVGEVPPEASHEYFCSVVDGLLFTRVLEDIGSQFDVAIFDTPSGFNGATLGALRATDWALSPLQAEPIALRTLPQLLTVVGGMREQGANLRMLGVVLCMLQQRNSDSLGVAEEVWNRLPADLVLETTIPRDVEALAASAASVPLGLMSRRRAPPLSLVFDRLAAELLPKLGLEMGEDDGPISLFA